MGELPFTVYFNLETTCGHKEYQHVEISSKNMYPVSYCFIVTFHPSLNHEKITVLRSFSDSFQMLNNISYLSDEMLRYFDPITAKQLQTSAENVL